MKKLKVDRLLALIVSAQLRQYKGLREISSCLNDEGISKALGLESIHASTISRRLASLPTEALETVFKRLKVKCISQIGLNATEALLGRLHLIDSSTISLCLTRYQWAEFRSTKSGIKVHLRLRMHEAGVIPDEIVMTPAKPARSYSRGNRRCLPAHTYEQVMAENIDFLYDSTYDPIIL